MYGSEPFGVLTNFWTTVKAGKKLDYGIKKVYITGVTPLPYISGTNDQENISFNPDFSTLCGLTRSDVVAALRAICSNEEEVQRHLSELVRHVEGYRCCQQQSVEPVFHTQTALSYLQVSK